MKKMLLCIMVLVFFVAVAGAQYSITLNTDEVTIGDNDPEFEVSWVRVFDVDEANPGNGELTLECRNVNNGDQPIRINNNH